DGVVSTTALAPTSSSSQGDKQICLSPQFGKIGKPPRDPSHKGVSVTISDGKSLFIQSILRSFASIVKHKLELVFSLTLRPIIGRRILSLRVAGLGLGSGDRVPLKAVLP